MEYGKKDVGKAMRENVSIVVLNYNDSETTIKLVDTLCHWDTKKYHIVVVDNKSLDDSYDRLLQKYVKEENVDVILSEKNGGYSYGNNFGVRFAIEKYNPKYIAIANPDIQIDENTFEKLLQTFAVDENIAMASPVMKNINGDYRIYTQVLPTYKDDLAACFNSLKSKTIVEKDFEYLASKKEMILTEMLPGSFFVIRSECFREIEMFDENVFLFCEERILGKRLKDRGYKAVLRSDLFFVHAHSVSIKKAYDIIKTWKILLKSRYYYQKKYNQISFAKQIILKVSMNLFLTGLKIKLNLYKLIRS